jgi:hypothetical protein
LKLGELPQPNDKQHFERPLEIRICKPTPDLTSAGIDFIPHCFSLIDPNRFPHCVRLTEASDFSDLIDRSITTLTGY